jgi:hypothetical protein
LTLVNRLKGKGVIVEGKRKGGGENNGKSVLI